MSEIVLNSSAPMPSCRIEGNRVQRCGHLMHNLKKLFCLFLAAGLMPVPHGRAEAAMHPEVAVAAYIVKETGSPNVLMAKDVDKPVSPASLTKILTSIMAIESGRLDDEVVIAREATLVEPTRAGFRPGDRILLRDLVKAAMVNSSNDAAFAIAIHLGGSVNSFVASMNARARSLGMSNSHFTNPAGFDVGPWTGNRTTARDLMLLTEHAVRNPEFNAIARLDRAVFKELSTGRAFSLKTHNKLLDLYPYTVGIKTGFTNRAGKCLVARAIKDRKDLLMVMLNARADRWSIASNMFDQGFGGGVDRLPMPVVARQDSEIAKPATGRQVAIEREKALDAIRQRVALQSGAGSAAGVNAGNAPRADRKLAMVSTRKGHVDAKSVLKMRRKAATERKLALKAAKHNPKESRVAMKARRKGPAETKLALKMKKGSRAGSAPALKTARKGKVENRAAMNQKKRGAEVTRVMKQKHRKDAVSYAAPSTAKPATV